jgi:GTP-binding protein
MKKWHGELIKTAFTKEQFPPERYPEIAFAGRSNVGKSSLINVLLGTKIAKVSSNPGKTRSINFYMVEAKSKFYLVDLPGFGYAIRDKGERNKWAKLIDFYSKNRSSLLLIVHLVDFRHGFLENDIILQNWMSSQGLQSLVVFTKVDKVPTTKRLSFLKKYAGQMPPESFGPLCVSSVNKTGVEELKSFLINYIDSTLEEKAKDLGFSIKN